MPLVEGQLVAELTIAFSQAVWAECAMLFARAVDNSIKMGTVQTGVTGFGVTPGGNPFSAVGAGIGYVLTPGPEALQAVMTAAFTSVTWSTVGPEIGSALNSMLLSSFVFTTVGGGLVGAGVGKITPTGLAALSAGITNSFMVSASWSAALPMVAIYILSFISSSIVTTNDFGAVPATGWTGSGIGNIV